jgi:lipopolysaccharide transport system permease protein
MGPEPEPHDDLPVTVIERRSGWHFIDLRELWRFRELLYFLTWRDLKVRYKQTVLGISWAVVQPLATMVVFSIFMGRAGGMADKVEQYPLFVFAAVLPWTFFANAIATAGNSLVGNERLVTRVYFPRLIVPLSCLGVALFDFLVSLALLAVLMAWYGAVPGWGLLLAPIIFLVLALAAAGIGSLLSALIVAQRDFRYVLTFGVQLWMFATPAIYLPDDAFGPRTRGWLALNPAQGLIYNFRHCLLGGEIDWTTLALSAAVSVAVLLAGCFYFRRVERGFADVI